MIFIDIIDAIIGRLHRRKIENMLCAEYSYKTDIAVKKEEAFQDGMEAGISQGAQQKAVEDALSFYANGVSIEIIAKSLHMAEEQVREIVNKPQSDC